MAKSATKRNIGNGAGGTKAKKRTRVQRFVAEYLVDLNGTQAAIRAGFSPASARFEASRLLATDEVKQAIEAAMQERSERTDIRADDVLRRIWNIATADARELIEMRRCCCRYCYGKNHLYQRTPKEMRDALAEFSRAQLLAQAKGEPFVGEFNQAGGIGYDPRKDPNPDCPECFGEGVERVFPKDSRDLSPSARMLFAGVKTTQHGLEIKTHDQSQMLIKAGEHLGLFKQRVEHSGPGGKDLPPGVVVVPAKADTSALAEPAPVPQHSVKRKARDPKALAIKEQA